MITLEDCKGTEADVAAEFYHKCQNLGLIVKMEVKLPSTVHRSKAMRADAVIFQLGKAICAVEFKCRRTIPLNLKSRQAMAYAGLGMPFFLCLGLHDIEETISYVVALADKQL